jgi:hypothetical protein
MRNLAMKRHFSKLVGASAIVASLAVLPFNAVQAQTTTDGTGTTTTTAAPNSTVYSDTANNNQGFDWGWLGLLGLLGLGGLAGKNRSEEPTRYRDPNTVGTSGYRE